MKKELFLSLSLLLSGCASLAPDAPIPYSDIPTRWGGCCTKTNLPSFHWNEVFPYSCVQKDIALAKETNKDLKTAALTALRAHQLIDAVDNLFSSYLSLEHSCQGELNPFCVSNNKTYGLLGVNLNVDLWGKVESATNAATFNAEAFDLTLENLQNMMAGDVIKSHLAIAYANQYQQMLNEMELILMEIENKVKNRIESGLPNDSDYSRILLKKAQILRLRQQIERQKSIAVESLRLLTSYHGVMCKECAQSLNELTPAFFTIPKTTSSSIIFNRPDIMALDKKMRANNALIGVAKANRLPQLNLPLEFAFPFSGAATWEIFPSISQVLFDGGRLKAIEDAATTTRDISLVEYERGVQLAFRDIANGISNASTLEKELEISEKAYKISDIAFKRSKLRNEAGYESLSDLIDRYDDLYSARIQILQVQFDRAKNTVDLFSAVGTKL